MVKIVKLHEFGGFDMQWSYHNSAGIKAASCPMCGVKCSEWKRPRQSRKKKLPYDFNDTYDGIVILSKRAKDFLETNWPDQIIFRQVFDNAWEAQPNRVLVVNNQNDITVFSSEYETGDSTPCPECGLYYCQTFKDYRFRFANTEIIQEDGIFRTDISFGHAFRGPLWLAGPKAALAISARFREVYLRPFDESDDGYWVYGIDRPFRADPEPDAEDPLYPDFLE